jgi:tetratricopeptide (TPR) repeat protein
MKNIKLHSLATVAGLGLLLIGCGDRLEIEPDNSVAASLAVNTSSDVEALLVGAYDILGDGDLYGGNLLRDGELLGGDDEVFWDGTFVAPGEIYNKRILVNNEQVEETWIEAYEAINITNNVLANLAVVGEGLEAQAQTDLRSKVEGEARFIRGTLYFELVRFYGRAWNDGDPAANLGVPLVLEPTATIDDESFVTRATVAQVYEQVLTDLQTAADLLPASNGFFATTYAAQGMLSRVYLMQGRYPEAAEAANKVITSGEYALNDDYADAFANVSTNTPEDVFAMQVTSQDGTNEMNRFFAPPSNLGRGDIYMLEPHLELYEEGDERLAFFYFDEDQEQTYTGKWTEQFGNVNILRLAEMYLTRAEANFRAGTTIGATPLEDINTIRTRAGLEPLTEVTLDIILRERHLELAFEGHRIHDLKRTGRPVGDLSFDSPLLVYPIPQREIDANPELESQQNPGYDAT